MHAKKHLGQHFLQSTKVLSDITEASALKKDDVVLEIGPGKGVLTELLLNHVHRVIAVEKDPPLVAFLEQKFSQHTKRGEFTLIQGDILKLSLENILPDTYKVVANIPYYITGAIIRKLLSNTPVLPEQIVIMIQKEVAERIIAREGKESILSLSIKAYGTPRYVSTVKAGSFSPPPSVDSAILSIENINRDFFKTFSEELFFSLIHHGFSQKRKKLSNNISQYIANNENIFTKCGLEDNVRAEDLTLQKWKCLAETVAQSAK